MNRRSFLKSTGLFAGGAFISLNANAFSLLENGEISGFVKHNKSGIANVVVSDGFSVVKTDKKGYYTFKLNDTSTHVFISTPAGYEFKAKQSVVQQYQTIYGKTNFNFSLTKLSVDDSKHNFLIWADPQVRTKKDVQQMMTTTVPDVQQLIKDLGAEALVHGITVGDIAWDKLEFFTDYSDAVRQMGIPFFQALGNHDMDYRQGGDETSDRTFKLNYGPTYYSFNRGKAHYVVLDDVRYLGSERNYDGYIVQNQLDWLKKDLELVPKDHLIIIGLHIPVGKGVKNKSELYSLLEGRQVHIMAGHTHYNNNYVDGNIYEHVHGTVCGAWWTGPVCGDGAPRGYGVYEVNGTELKWFYKSTGLDKSHQISIHLQELTAQKRMIANVWNWDPEWKIEYWADEKYMGVLESTKGYDPETVTLYKGDKLPTQGRTFAEPKRTNHLFMAHLEPQVKTLKVQATDRFGNKYQKTANV